MIYIMGLLPKYFSCGSRQKKFWLRLRIVYREAVVVYRVKTSEWSHFVGKDEADLKTQTSCIQNRYVTDL